MSAMLGTFNPTAFRMYSCSMPQTSSEYAPSECPTQITLAARTTMPMLPPSSKSTRSSCMGLSTPGSGGVSPTNGVKRTTSCPTSLPCEVHWTQGWGGCCYSARRHITLTRRSMMGTDSSISSRYDNPSRNIVALPISLCASGS